MTIATAHSLGVARLRGRGRARPGGEGRSRSQRRGARSCPKAERPKCWCTGPGVGCTGTREGWEGWMQIPAGNGDRGLFGTLAGAPWRRRSGGRRELEVPRPGRNHGPFPNFNPSPMMSPSFYDCVTGTPGVAAALRRGDTCPRNPGDLRGLFKGAEKEPKPRPPFPDEPTPWSKAPQRPGMLREGSPPLLSQNHTSPTPSPV